MDSSEISPFLAQRYIVAHSLLDSPSFAGGYSLPVDRKFDTLTSILETDNKRYSVRVSASNEMVLSEEATSAIAGSSVGKSLAKACVLWGE